MGWTLLAVTACALLAGCNAFNPAFNDLLDPSGQLSSIPNAPGHVVITFVNNADVDGRLLTHLTGPGELVLTAEELQSLTPRIRMRVRVTFTNGTTQTFEFIDGSTNLVEQSFNAEVLPDLNQNDLSNVVVVCDVARVEVVPGSQIEVFIPAALQEYEQRQIQTAGGDTGETQDILRQTISPRFWALRLDDVDEDNNVILRRNIDIRDAPVAVVNPVCGTVIAITMSGAMTVPFWTKTFPAYDLADEATVAGIGGRFEFRVVSIE